MEIPPVAATSVGSFPKPSWLVRRRDPQSGAAGLVFELEGDALREAQEDATVVAMLDQEQAGLDLLTDGEQRRVHFINHILARWDGIDLGRWQPKEVRRRTRKVDVPTVVDGVRRREPALVDELRYAKSQTTNPVKMAVPGPVTVVDTTYDEAYGDEAALAMDVAVAINAELLDLQAAGADALQLDEPAMTRWHEKVADYGARALDRCLEGITVPTFVHLCYGYGGSDERQHYYEYPELLEMLMQTRIGGFSLEFARSGYDPSLLSICGDRLVMFGCVNPGDAPLEPLDDVAAMVREALRYVAPERLLVAPDCGLMTVSREQARAKAQLVAEAAGTVRRSL